MMESRWPRKLAIKFAIKIHLMANTCPSLHLLAPNGKRAIGVNHLDLQDVIEISLEKEWWVGRDLNPRPTA
jgi:hypothetical protein